MLRDGELIEQGDALNDVVLHKLKVARLFSFETYIDGVFVNSQRSDGMIISTPTGSTAYALSGGGPIVHPGLKAILMVPICPHTLSFRPIIVQDSSTIELVISASHESHLQLTCDGQEPLSLMARDTVRIKRHTQCVNLIHPVDYDYYSALRLKLNWGQEL